MNTPAKTATTVTRAKPRRRILRVIGWLALALFVGLGIVLFWALNTESGARFAMARVQTALDGKLVVGRSSGSLSGPLVLDDVRYLDPASGIDARIKHLSIDPDIFSLLGQRVEIGDIVANDVNVALTTVAAKPDDGSAFSLTPPIDVIVDKLALQRATITQDGKPVLVVDRLDLVGGWTSEGLLVKQLELRSPDGRVDLSGSLGTLGGYSGSGETTFAWRLGETDLAGVIKSRSDGKQAHIDVNLTKPTPATATITVGQTATAAWTLVLDAPRFNAKSVLPDSTLGEFAVQLQGSGDKTSAELAGSLEIDKRKLILDPLRATLNQGIVTIDQLHLTSPETPGSLDVTGTLDTAAAPLSANLQANWKDIVLPADLAGQELASHGGLSINGSAEQFAAKGSLALGPPGALADIDVDVNGTAELITLNTVRLKQASGGLDARGTLTLQPTLGWNIKATANQFDPGAFFADWKGAMDFVLDTVGTQTAKGPDATFVLSQVGGTLRQKPLSGSADLHLKPDYIVDGQLELKSGGSRIRVEGSGGSETDAHIRFEVASLGDWLPQAAGTANGNIKIGGKWPKLDVDGDITGKQLAWSGVRVDTLELVAKITNLEKPAGALTLKATDVNRGDVHFDTLDLAGDGNAKSHQLTLSAKGIPASLDLTMSGGSEKGRWDGQLKKLHLDPSGRNLPDFNLDKAAGLSWEKGRFALAESCLIGKVATRAQTIATGSTSPATPQQVAEESVEPEQKETPARLCISGSSEADGSLAGKYQLEHLPLRLLVRLASPDSPMRLRGEIHGSGDIARNKNGPISGNARLLSDQGEVFYIGGGNKPLLSYTGFTVEANLTGSATTAKIGAALDHDGRIDGNLTMTPTEGNSQALAGNIKLNLNSLGFVELLTTEVSNTQGKLSADYTIAGTLAEPRLDGALNLVGFATEVPGAGLKLHDGTMSLRAVDANRYVLEGTIQSGKGSLTISGEGGLGANEPMKATIKGEQFLAADIPAARVIIDPNLSIQRSTDGILVTGQLGIPSANVDLSKLPGGGASSISPDVVVVDANEPAPGQPVPITARIAVTLGDKVKLAGFGFDGSLSGTLAVIERPGRSTIGNGTLNAAGTYKAYGQDLKIETGRILFASSPIDNPGLDIRATRTIKADDVTAGLLVRGTAQVPQLTVFANPAMEQSGALSYLITGKPLSSLKSGEGDMLGTAARALGTAGGDLLAKSIGGKIGVDDIGVADNDALGGAAFTVGKYLSPKLYLSYGVGVFDPGEVVTLRYLFSARWNFEAQNATNGSRAGFNYRYEN